MYDRPQQILQVLTDDMSEYDEGGNYVLANRGNQIDKKMTNSSKSTHIETEVELFKKFFIPF